MAIPLRRANSRSAGMPASLLSCARESTWAGAELAAPDPQPRRSNRTVAIYFRAESIGFRRESDQAPGSREADRDDDPLRTHRDRWDGACSSRQAQCEDSGGSDDIGPDLATCFTVSCIGVQARNWPEFAVAVRFGPASGDRAGQGNRSERSRCARQNPCRVARAWVMPAACGPDSGTGHPSALENCGPTRVLRPSLKTMRRHGCLLAQVS